MKLGFRLAFTLFFLLVHCITSSQTELPQEERSEKTLRLQYAQELETKVLKVGPAHEISIGQFALQSFSNTSSRFFTVSSLSPLKSNDPLEPGAIVLRKVQVDRSLEFEEGTTKFHHATFVSIVEFVVVGASGEPQRILGHSEQITSRTIPFSADDTDSKDKIANSIQSAIEEGLQQIVSLKDFPTFYKSQNMFQR
ncbi:hypothetical protein [Leptospira vanthielii]|uniref:Lipoprotein n=1 Tax=Leptospira vanthielii serovar Holland str. Waz Holland = ATCC 700522 TaxID=1218591 RepID=N1W6I8_9LEPT|nr:hypothetical protein [Leptospira vanthielii]EMY68862.1 hypothetical protein LEP1GSC199_1854 [Leptospira vanthielii serovar Holland str. Waz Holland = ATCC 700522]